MKNLYTLLFLIVVNAKVYSQYLPNNAAPFNSVSHLVNNVLLSNGVTAFNIQFHGGSQQIGHFNNGNGSTIPIGIDNGIVISTGDIFSMANPQGTNASTIIQPQNNFPMDPDILSILQENSSSVTSANDIASLE